MTDQEFYNGAEGRGKGSGDRGAVPRKKIEFLPEIGGFWCILGLLFTFMQKLVRSMGGGRPPPESATVFKSLIKICDALDETGTPGQATSSSQAMSFFAVTLTFICYYILFIVYF